jgi:hypothetical protein
VSRLRFDLSSKESLVDVGYVLPSFEVPNNDKGKAMAVKPVRRHAPWRAPSWRMLSTKSRLLLLGVAVRSQSWYSLRIGEGHGWRLSSKVDREASATRAITPRHHKKPNMSLTFLLSCQSLKLSNKTYEQSKTWKQQEKNLVKKGSTSDDFIKP